MPEEIRGFFLEAKAFGASKAGGGAISYEFNGKEYASLQDMPPEARALFARLEAVDEWGSAGDAGFAQGTLSAKEPSAAAAPSPEEARAAWRQSQAEQRERRPSRRERLPGESFGEEPFPQGEALANFPALPLALILLALLAAGLLLSR
jgi:hypothetical protein